MGVALDSNINFNTHIHQKIKKCNEMIGLIRRFSKLPRNALITIYKHFIRPDFDYGDNLYDKPNNENFQSKMQKVQNRACLVITSGIQGTFRELIYDELRLHSLVKQRWRKKLVFL